jgi:2,4-didehydro-3-deoxy-L-rhamnonate hydrolase
LAPKQIFAVGLNYVDHAQESGVSVPTSPVIFTKFVSCLAGPNDSVTLPSDSVDWEIELVVVMSKPAYKVPADEAWDHVAGLMIGQDLSERQLQLAGPVPQFSLGKSYPGFGPIGPALVTPDELDDPNDLAMTCTVDNAVVQQGRSSEMVFSVSELICHISAVCPMEPGDLIFTGTPPGVGLGRKPPVYLRPGQVLRSAISGLGELRNVLESPPDAGLRAS